MKCNRCGKEIDELEIFCDDCKKELKNISSRSDVKELESLIEEQKRFNDLENTKELVDLDKLIEEELSNEDSTLVIEDKSETKEEIIIQEDNDFIETEKKEKKKNNKKIIILISIISLVLLIGVIVLIVLLGNNKKDSEVEEKKTDYEKVLKTYGVSISKIVKQYLKENEEVPTWEYVIENLDFKDYEVSCNNHFIYKDGNIYLSECKIDNKKVKYTYGIEQEVKGMEIKIYEQDGEYLEHTPSCGTGLNVVGSVTCKTDSCQFYQAYNKYVIIKETEEYYLYDYTNNTLKFGPFIFNSEYGVLVYNNELYGVFYKEDNKNNIYSVNSNKIIKDVKGSLLESTMNYDPAIMYKYNYVILVNNGKNNFINLKTGNISYTIEENINTFIENNNIVYIISYKENYNKFKIYNSNGKALFEGKEYNNFLILPNGFLVSTKNTFKTYGSNLTLETTSKKYDEILAVYEDLIIGVKDSNLFIVDLKDKELAKFDNAFSSEFIFDKSLIIKDNTGIYIILENKNLPSNSQGKYIEYYYKFETKESGFTEKNSI